MDQATMQAIYGQEFAGVDNAQIYGSGRNFEPGKGRLVFGAAKINHGDKKTFIQECSIKWFRGGVKLDGTRIPDSAFAAGDDVSYVVNFAWKSKDSHFKQWGLAVMQAAAKKRGQDPNAITADMIKGATCAQILATQMQSGLEVDFEVVENRTREGGVFTKVMFHGAQQETPPAMQAPPAQATPAPTTQPTAAAAGGSSVDPLAALMGAAGAPAAPVVQTPAASVPVGGASALDALMGSAGVAASAPADPLAALMGGAPAAPPAAPTRDEKIAAIRAARPELRLADFTTVSDDAINAAFASIPK